MGDNEGKGLITETADFGAGDEAVQKRWKLELEEAQKAPRHRKFIADAKKSKEVFSTQMKDDGGPNAAATVKHNLWWEYNDAIAPAIFSRSPQVVVKETPAYSQNPIARKAVMLLESNLRYFGTDLAENFFGRGKQAVCDYQLTGRGVLWPRYDWKEGGAVQARLSAGQLPPEGVEVGGDDRGRFYESRIPDYERVIPEFIHYEDYLESPARTPEEVRWKAKRTYQTKDIIREHFGEEVAKAVPFKSKFSSTDATEEQELKDKIYQRAEVWEIHNLEDRKVYFICPDAEKPLKVEDDFLELRGFFPTPAPLCATLDNDSTIPVSDFSLFSYTLDKVDELTRRIAILTRAIKVIGVYNSRLGELKDIYSKMDATMVPMQSWEEFAEMSGFDGAARFVPIEPFVLGIEKLREEKQNWKEDFYELSGYSNVMRSEMERGQSAASVQKAAYFTNLRLSKKQEAIQRYFVDIFNIMGEIVAKKFELQTILSIAGHKPQMMAPEELMEYQQAFSLLRSPERCYVIEITTDSMIANDETQEKRDRIEFMNMAGQFLQQIQGLVQTSPVFIPAAIQMFLFGLDSFRVGRPIEEELKKALMSFMEQQQQAQEQEPPPDPKMMEAQTKAELGQKELELKMQLGRRELDLRFMELQAEYDRKGMDAQMKFELKSRQVQDEQMQFVQKMQFDMQRFYQDLQWKYQQLQVQLNVANQKGQSEAMTKQTIALQQMQTEALGHQQDMQLEMQKHMTTLASKREIEMRKQDLDAAVRVSESARQKPEAPKITINMKEEEE